MTIYSELPHQWMKREPGESPGRSRHCESEQAAFMSLRHDTREGAVSVELKSGDLLILCIFEILTDDRKALCVSPPPVTIVTGGVCFSADAIQAVKIVRIEQ